MTDDRKNVLVVDDERSVGALISRSVQEAGYTCDCTTTAEEGLAQLGSKTYDVIIADIVLPGMSGLDLLDRVRERCDTDVIVVTGYADDHSYAEAVARGAADFVVKPVRAEELILRLQRVMRERENRLAREKMMEELQKLVITDSLTGLFNSRHFFAQIEIEMERAGRYDNALALLLTDVDRFKHFNDSYGHLNGDQVLARVGEIIRSCLRRSDSAYRYGGEEFIMLLPEATAQESVGVAERLRDAIARENFIPRPGETCGITISVGLTEYSHAETVHSFVQRADAAMYKSKAKGRNSVTVLLSERVESRTQSEAEAAG